MNFIFILLHHVRNLKSIFEKRQRFDNKSVTVNSSQIQKEVRALTVMASSA